MSETRPGLASAVAVTALVGAIVHLVQTQFFLVSAWEFQSSP